jgi:hypothetical protein
MRVILAPCKCSAFSGSYQSPPTMNITMVASNSFLYSEWLKKQSTCHCKNQTAKQLSLRLQQLLLRCYPKWSQLVSPCLESYCDPVRSYCKFAYLICQIRHSVSHLDRWRMSGLFQTWKCGFVHHLAEFHLEILDELLMNSDIC